ncbi:hypothetical protein DPMN_130341 [Dreissena polymorpha]|nr:hypothetical protein DPMN_130341 [Dreissena polymorpha]
MGQKHSKTLGSDQDCQLLRDFFGLKLRFVIDECHDKTKAELIQHLKRVKKKVNKRYYCFICVIMVHGNETGIATCDDPIHPNEIKAMFDNTRMAKYAGKPKLF